MLTHIVAGFVTFATVFLKGFQHKNVIGGHYRLIAVTSYAMSFCDVFLIGIVAHSGWEISFACGTGAACGMVASVWLHDRLLRRGAL